MAARTLPVTADEFAEVIRRRDGGASPFPGFVLAPERQSAGLEQLREHLSEDHLRGELLSETQLVARAAGRAEALEREVGEREGGFLALLPLEERFADYPQTLRVLGLSEPSPRDRGPSDELSGLELGPGLRRLLGRSAAS